jgi:hypothetical protein
VSKSPVGQRLGQHELRERSIQGLVRPFRSTYVRPRESRSRRAPNPRPRAQSRSDLPSPRRAHAPRSGGPSSPHPSGLDRSSCREQRWHRVWSSTIQRWLLGPSRAPGTDARSIRQRRRQPSVDGKLRRSCSERPELARRACETAGLCDEALTAALARLRSPNDCQASPCERSATTGMGLAERMGPRRSRRPSSSARLSYRGLSLRLRGIGDLGRRFQQTFGRTAPAAVCDAQEIRIAELHAFL